jgi:16S rRNA processing protein RimM
LTADKNFIIIGKIQKTIGLNGLLNVKPLTDFPDRFLSMKYVNIFNERNNLFIKNKITGNNKFEIEKINLEKDFVKIIFRYYTSRELAGELINTLIVIDEKDKISLRDNKFYFFDLIGCEIKCGNDSIGKVISIENYGGDDLLNILLTKNNKNFLLPLIKNFVKKIDIENKLIQVDLIEGFIDNNL